MRHSGASRKAKIKVHNPVFSVCSWTRLLPGGRIRLILQLTQDEKVKIFFKGNKPFFATVLYRDADGNIIQILPNPFRKDNYFQGGVIYETPSGNDKFDLEVAQPFGEESVAHPFFVKFGYERIFMKKAVLICLLALFFSGCSTIDMRKISIDPNIPPPSFKKSSLNAGLLLDSQLTGYIYTFETGKQIFLLSGVKGEVDVGKNLSQALYGIVSNKFGNVVVAREAGGIHDVDIYLVPWIKYFKYSPPFTGLSSHHATIELETEIFSGDHRKLGSFSIKQDGNRNSLNQLRMETNYDLAHYAINEAIDNFLKEFSRKLDELY
jgi:hypothetical protein